MKTFKQFCTETNDNVDPMDVKRAYYKLKAKKDRNEFEEQKLKVLADHPDVKGK